MNALLANKRVAILATDGFEQSELEEPRAALEAAAADVEIVSPRSGHIQGMRHAESGDRCAVDRRLDDACPDDYDALMLPGGLMNPDELRSNPAAVKFVREFVESGKPVAAICHAAWLLIEADVLHGRQLTSWPAIQTDVRNAGGDWLDAEVVVDNGLVTSRSPDDLPAFNRRMIEEFAEARRPVTT